MSIDTKRYIEQDLEAVWHPYSRRSAMKAGSFPVITKGQGVYLYDSKGGRYIDGISSWWCCNLGHTHPRLVEAITRQAAELQHSILGNLSHPRAIELATRLSALFGGGRHVLFASDGAGAVEAALKVAVQYWYNRGERGRDRFVALSNAYHGDTLGAVSVGFVEKFHAPFKSLLFPVYRADSPCCGECPLKTGAGDCWLECFQSMKRILETHHKRIAAVIVEPMCQGAAGMRIYKAEYLRRLAALCRELDVLLIADEIAVGFGRTGRMFAFEHAGIAPDIVCVGKSLAAGYLPISATVVADSIYATFDDAETDCTFYHGHTFAGNPIAAAAALEMLSVYEDERILRNVGHKSEILARELGMLRGVPGVLDVRCLGMIGAVAVEDASPARMEWIRTRALAEGLLMRPLGNVVYLMLPLSTSDALIERAAGILVNAVRAASETSGPAATERGEA